MRKKQTQTPETTRESVLKNVPLRSGLKAGAESDGSFDIGKWLPCNNVLTPFMAER